MWQDALRIIKDYLPHKVVLTCTCTYTQSRHALEYMYHVYGNDGRFSQLDEFQREMASKSGT